MKRTLVFGLVIQGFAGIMSALSYNYTQLASSGSLEALEDRRL